MIAFKGKAWFDMAPLVQTSNSNLLNYLNFLLQAGWSMIQRQ